MSWLTLFTILVLVIWFGLSVAAVVVPPIYLRLNSDQDTFIWVVSVSAVVCGVASLLLFLAVLSGEVKAGHPDGCYFIHTQLIGKTLVQQWDPIECH